MKKRLLNLAFAFPLAMVAASSATAQTILASQNRSPATFEQYPYRPACRQLTAAPGSADGWFGWGPTIKGEHQNWRGIEASVPPEQAYKRLAAVGLCVLDGELVPFEQVGAGSATDTGADKNLSLLEQRAAAVKARNAERKANGESDFPSLLAVLAAIGAGVYFWWDNKTSDDGDFPTFAPFAPPMVVPPLPTERDRPTPSELMSATAALNREPATATDQPVPQNPAMLLAMRQRQTLVTAKPRTGKSITVSLAWPKVQAEGVYVACLQPKYHPTEKRYWDGTDSLCGFMLENWQMGEGDRVLIDGERTAQLDKEQLAKQLTDYLIAWRKHPAKRKLLIIDELRALKEVLPDWYRDVFVPFLVVEMSSGETSGRIVWAITQSSLCGDIGFSGGDRSMFDLFVLETPESAEHYSSVRNSFKGLPVADKALYAYSESPKQSIFYHSVLGDWAPMVRFPEPASPCASRVKSAISDSGYDVAKISTGSPSVNRVNARYTRAEMELLLRVSVNVKAEIGALVSALEGVKQGDSKTDIITKSLGMTGRNYSEGVAKSTTN